MSCAMPALWLPLCSWEEQVGVGVGTFLFFSPSPSLTPGLWEGDLPVAFLVGWDLPAAWMADIDN